MIFNKTNTDGALELQQLTGNYYANNDFSRIAMGITLEIESLVKLIGLPVYTRAENFYLSGRFAATDQSPAEKIDQSLVQHIQLLLALRATYNHYRENLVSHEDAGRKIKIDNDHEKMPWEWMFDRDDLANLSKANKALDRLINFLEANQITEWISGDVRKKIRPLLIPDALTFNQFFPIDESSRFFYTVVPFIHEVQRTHIKNALGVIKYNGLITYFQQLADTGSPPDQGSSPDDDPLAELLYLVQAAIPLYVMAIAAKRLSLQVLPDGVVQQFRSMIQSVKASQPALDDTRRNFIRDILADAAEALDQVKRFLNTQNAEVLNYNLLPDNDADNKYFRT